jgi:hypothetical protein
MGKPNMIYIGPNVPPLALKRNTLYRGDDIPPRLLELAERRPALKSLFISTRDLAEAQKKIAKKGTLEHTAQQEMLEIAKTIPR